MEGLVDIHNHTLFGVDDGAADFNETCRMLVSAYNDGIRCICLSPHYNPALFRDVLAGNIIQNFKIAQDFVKQKLPGMQICLGSEIYFYPNIVDLVKGGVCFPLNGSRYLLVEFAPGDSFYEIKKGTGIVLNSGYIPVLAHTERYECILSHSSYVTDLIESGVRIQLNSSSVLGKSGFRVGFFAKHLLKKRYADVIASDAHNVSNRAPVLLECYKHVSKHFGEEYADKLFIQNPIKFITPNKY